MSEQTPTQQSETVAELREILANMLSLESGMRANDERWHYHYLLMRGNIELRLAKAERRQSAELRAAGEGADNKLVSALREIHMECLDEGHTDSGVMSDCCEQRGQVIRCGICAALETVRLALQSVDSDAVPQEDK